MNSIVITGAHHNSALVVAQKLKRRGYAVTWFGHRYTCPRDRRDSAEYREVTSAAIPFYSLYAGKLSSPPRLGELLRIPIGIFHALYLLSTLRPLAVFSFGSYLGATTAFAAYCLGIPVFIHEQTLVGGKANLWTSRFARRIYLTWPSSSRYFPQRAVVVGLPIDAELYTAKPQKLFNSTRPTILILGGKQGAHAINQTIFAAHPRLTKHYNLIHQTGTSSQTGDYEQSLRLVGPHYRSYSYISRDTLASLYGSADLVVSRSGAHTAYELALLGKRAILIPYMHTTRHEQMEQARLLRAAGLATILPQAELTPDSLLSNIKQALETTPPTPMAVARDAAEIIVADLAQELA